MTCIIGLVSGNRVYIGGDSVGASDYDYQLRADEKVFRNGNMVFGFTDSFRMGQLLRYSLEIPKQTGRDDFTYLCTTFMDAVIDVLVSKYYATLKDNKVRGGNFLLGYRRKLYRVASDFQVEKVISNFNAIGCGSSYALGAMEVLHNQKQRMSPSKKIIKCLRVVEKYSAGVKSPFHVISLDDKSDCSTHVVEE